MASKILKLVFALWLGSFSVAIIFYFQPWADYPASFIVKVFDAKTRVDNFRRMDQFSSSVVVKAGDNSFHYGRNESAINPTYQFEGQNRNLDDFLERTVTTGLVIIKDGEIVHERYLHGEQDTSLHTSWSVVKSFISTLIGIAIDDGLIHSVNDKASDYVPALEGTAYGAATIEDILQMSSGVTFAENYGEANGNTSFVLSDAQKVIFRTQMFGSAMDDMLAAYGKLEEPGQRFEYRSSDTHILSWILREVIDMPIEDYLSEKLWQPLGMEADGFWNTDATGTPIGFCCLSLRLRDYAKLGTLFLNGGNWQGQQIVSKSWVKQATRPSKLHLEPENVFGVRGYQYQWWVPKDYDGEFFAAGIWGQFIWVSEKHNMVIARTSVDPNFQNNMAESIAVFRALTNQFDTVDQLLSHQSGETVMGDLR